jgi:hypothetical protein
MAITTNGMDFQSRVPLPGMVSENEAQWRADFGKILASGHRPRKPFEYMVLNEVVVKTKEITVHSFKMGDVEDPDLMAAEPLWNWQQSSHGQWVMSNAVETPVWHRMADPINWGHQYIITATFTEKKLTEYYLRWGNDAYKRVSM